MVAALLVVLAVRAALPLVVQAYINHSLKTNPQYGGHVGNVDLGLVSGHVALENLVVFKRDTGPELPLLSAPRIDFNLGWRPLFHRMVVCSVGLRQPEINIEAERPPTPLEKQAEKEKAREEKAQIRQAALPVRVVRLDVAGARVRYIDHYADPEIDMAITRLDLKATNITNSKRFTGDRIANVDMTGAPLGDGQMRVHVSADPLADQPTFNLDAELKGIDMTKLNDFLRAYGKFDVSKGRFSVYSELAGADGSFKGYVKPMFQDVKVLNWDKDKGNPAKLFREAAVGTAKELLKNDATNRVATKVPLSGRIEDPHANVWKTVASLLRNAFIRALVPGVEGSVSFRDLGK